MTKMPPVTTYLLGLLRPYRRRVAYFITLSTIGAALGTAAPVLLGHAFDGISRHNAMGVTLVLLFAWALLRFVQDAIANYVSNAGGQSISIPFANGFKNEFVARLLKKPMSFHYGENNRSLPDVSGRVYWRLVNFIEMVVFDTVPAVIATLAIVTYLSWLWWPLAAAFVFLLAVYVTLTIRFVPSWSEAYWKFSEHLDKAGDIGWDAITNIRVVKSVAGEQFIIGRMGDQSRRADSSISNVARLDLHFGFKRSGLFGLTAFAVVALACWRFSAGLFTFGQLTTVTAYMLTVFGYFTYFNWQYRMILELKQNYAKAAAIMDEPEEDLTHGEEIALQGGIAFRDVHFAYTADRPILKGVSFNVKPGQQVALVGGSGEGKTTIIDLLGRYWSADGGDIELDGRDVTGLSLRSLRSQMAYVPQDITLFHESLLDNVRFGRPEATDEEVRNAMRRARLDGLLERLPEGEATKVGERGLKLSGGERQRVAIARAFLRDPKILILDEPTSQLDAKTEEELQASLAELMRGRTTFIVAHRLRTVRDADLILVIKDGVVAEQGTHAELAARDGGVYRALLEAQSNAIS